MPDDYLWDRSGKPDPDVERLERSLKALGAPEQEPDWNRIPVPPARPAWFAQPWVRGFAIAAGVAFVVAIAWPRHPRDGWEVTAANEGTVARGGLLSPLAPGGRVETRAGESVRIAVSGIGEVELAPNSRLRRLGGSGTERRLALERGELTAFIVAPPRQFVVETPAGVASDLGCAYTLRTDERGEGGLDVLSGWVAFAHEGRECFVPAEAHCATFAGGGAGTPHFTDASPALIEALGRFDRHRAPDAERAAALEQALAAARPRDAFTLWHLLAAAPAPLRLRVASRMAELAPPPAGVTAAGAAAGDQAMRDRWWDSLGLGDASWWRMWEGDLPRRM